MDNITLIDFHAHCPPSKSIFAFRQECSWSFWPKAKKKKKSLEVSSFQLVCFPQSKKPKFDIFLRQYTLKRKHHFLSLYIEIKRWTLGRVFSCWYISTTSLATWILWADSAMPWGLSQPFNLPWTLFRCVSCWIFP